MNNLTYLALLEQGEDGSYSISFPDLPGCFSYGENLTHAHCRRRTKTTRCTTTGWDSVNVTSPLTGFSSIVSSTKSSSSP